MTKTVSFHNGSEMSQDHNRRTEGHIKETDKHIDKALSKDNITLLDRDIEEAYHDLFDKAVEEYNSKQNRKDRQIDDYYSKVVKEYEKATASNNAHNRRTAKKPAYEAIVQIGDRLDTGLHSCEKEEQALIKFMKEFSKRNPNLEVIGLYIHKDEADGTVHGHIDYIPYSDGHKRGLDRQIGLQSALEAQGSLQGKEALVQWTNRERDRLKEIAREFGIEVAEPKKEYRKHLDTELFKVYNELQETVKANDELTKKNSELQKENTKLSNKVKKLQGQVKKSKDIQAMTCGKNIFGKVKDKVVLDYQDYMDLRTTALEVDNIDERLKDVEEREYSVRIEERQLRTQQNSIDKQREQIYRDRQELNKAIETVNHQSRDLQKVGEDKIKAAAKKFMEPYKVNGVALYDKFNEYIQKQQVQHRDDMER